MSFAASAPPASDKQVAYLLNLLQRAGHQGFRDARHPLGLTQRQAAGRFSRSEASALIDQLLGADDADTDDGAGPGAPAATELGRRAVEERAALARGLPADVLADELRRRGWHVAAP